MKLIALGDIHIDDSLPYSDPPGNRLEEELIPAWTQVLKYAQEHKIINMALSGDTFNNISVSPRELCAFLQMFKLASTHGIQNIYANSGNHELDEKGFSIIQYLKEIGFIKLWHPEHLSRCCIIGDFCMHMINFCHEETDFLKTLHSTLENCNAKRRILLAHQAVRGSKLKAIKSAKGLSEELFKKSGMLGANFALCIFGDFHRSQDLPYKKGFYTGCIVQQDFRDEGSTPSFYVVDTTDMSYKRIPLDVPCFHTVIVEEAENTHISKIEHSGYIKIVLTGTAKFVKDFTNSKQLDKLVKYYKKEYKPRRVVIASPHITEKIIPTKAMMRQLNDEELIQQVIDNDTTSEVPDKKLYLNGLNFIKRARILQRRR